MRPLRMVHDHPRRVLRALNFHLIWVAGALVANWVDLAKPLLILVTVSTVMVAFIATYDLSRPLDRAFAVLCAAVVNVLVAAILSYQRSGLRTGSAADCFTMGAVFGFATLVVGLLCVLLFAIPLRHARYFWRPGLCDQCGYSLEGNVSGRCPECGQAVARGATTRRRNQNRHRR